MHLASTMVEFGTLQHLKGFQCKRQVLEGEYCTRMAGIGLCVHIYMDEARATLANVHFVYGPWQAPNPQPSHCPQSVAHQGRLEPSGSQASGSQASASHANATLCQQAKEQWAVEDAKENDKLLIKAEGQ